MSLQSRGRKAAEKRRSEQKKRTELEQSLKLEKLKALDKTSGKGKNRESGIKRGARKTQIKTLEKKVNKPMTVKTTSNVMPKPKRATDKGGRSAVPGTMRGKQVDTKMGPNMSKVIKPDAKPTPKKEEKFDRMAAARNQQRMAQKSMGFKKGGKVRGDGICKKGKTRGRMV